MQAVVGLFSACWAQDGRVAELGGVRGEVLAGVAVVADDRLAAAQRDREQPAGDVALFVVGAGKDHRAIVPSGAPSMAWATHNVTTPRGARSWRPPARTTSAAVIPAGFGGCEPALDRGGVQQQRHHTRSARGATTAIEVGEHRGPHRSTPPRAPARPARREGKEWRSAGRGAERDAPLRGLPCTYGVHRSPRVGFGPCWSAAQRTSAARARGVSHTRAASPATPRAGRATISAAVIISPGVPCPALAAPFLMVAGTDRAPPTTIRAP
jgi:hypothetical protein